MSYSMSDHRAAKAALIAAGWIPSHSVMHDGGASGSYGSCFIRIGANGARERFYLNKDSYQHLPIDDPRIDGYNVEFLGAKPPKAGEDY